MKPTLTTLYIWCISHTFLIKFSYFCQFLVYSWIFCYFLSFLCIFLTSPFFRRLKNLQIAFCLSRFSMKFTNQFGYTQCSCLIFNEGSQSHFLHSDLEFRKQLSISWESLLYSFFSIPWKKFSVFWISFCLFDSRLAFVQLTWLPSQIYLDSLSRWILPLLECCQSSNCLKFMSNTFKFMSNTFFHIMHCALDT